MMCVDPNARLNIAQVLEHPWLAADADIINRVEKILTSNAVIPNRSTKRSIGGNAMSIDGDQAIFPETNNLDANGQAKRRKY